ncbi:hypothetical protein ACOSP7_016471 [Xanthoceras sorbifolium]
MKKQLWKKVVEDLVNCNFRIPPQLFLASHFLLTHTRALSVSLFSQGGAVTRESSLASSFFSLSSSKG